MNELPGQQSPRGLLVTGDLIFSTKVTGTARALGFEVNVLSSPQLARERLATAHARCVILDLSLSALSPEAIRELVAAAGAPVIAFGSHVDTERLAAARQAGCSDVMPRSRFAGSLPEILRQYLGGEG